MSSSARAQARAHALAQAKAHDRARVLRRRRLMAGGIAVTVIAVAAAVGISLGGSSSASAAAVPPGATAAGGILVGSPSAPVQIVAYEDPQCPSCERFETMNGSALQGAVRAGKVAVEYRMRSFLGVESVRADNALAAAQAAGRFEALREAIYAHQPREHTGGFTTQDLLSLGASVGLTDSSYVDAVRSMKYAGWVAAVDDRASRDGNMATPELHVGGRVLTAQQISDPAAFKAALGI